jgi:hypothetical protein
VPSGKYNLLPTVVIRTFPETLAESSVAYPLCADGVVCRAGCENATQYSISDAISVAQATILLMVLLSPADLHGE